MNIPRNELIIPFQIVAIQRNSQVSMGTELSAAALSWHLQAIIYQFELWILHFFLSVEIII